ncbi:NAD(P)-dependent oxidoreductase [Patescibacteria group bacterium]|nr:NAD(P)-dependent oxidoreductase [Patescibacteria group bacterium]
MDIIGTGLSGLVGSRVTSLLSGKFSFTDLSKETGIDLMDFPKVQKMITSSDSSWVFHFAAYTDVQGAEMEKAKGKKSISWQVNVRATENIVNICRDTGKKLLYISTDYVFDGTKEEYYEDDSPNPILWYGRTKYEGEKLVQTLGIGSLIVRIANPYRSNPVGKIDFVHKILERMNSGLEIQAPSDQLFCPTYIDDLAISLEKLISAEASGIYHVVSLTGITPYEAAKEIALEFGYKDALITPVSYTQYFSGKALPPRHTLLKHDKIDFLGVKLHTFQEGLHILKQQERK